MTTPVDAAKFYGSEFAADYGDGSYLSASIVLPTLREATTINSVVDVGCASGAWLAAARDVGISEILGIDGKYTPMSALRIPSEDFMAMNLEHPSPIGRLFDLAICLEVASDLPEASAAPFVEFLAELAPLVLFSSALPDSTWPTHQNRQWPWYWEDKFAQVRYRAIDFVRPRVWQDSRVSAWYRQKMMLFASESWLDGSGQSLRQAADVLTEDLTIVSKRTLRYLAEPGLKRGVSQLPGIVGRSLRWRLARH